MSTAAVSTPVRSVTVAFWLFIAAAIVNAIVGLLALLSIGRVNDVVQRAQQRSGSSQIPSGTLAGIGVGTVIATVVIALLWAVAVVVFAVQLRRGRAWARIVLTVLVALSIVGVLGLGFVVFALGVVGVVFSWLTSSTAWFRGEGTRVVPGY